MGSCRTKLPVEKPLVGGWHGTNSDDGDCDDDDDDNDNNNDNNDDEHDDRDHDDDNDKEDKDDEDKIVNEMTRQQLWWFRKAERTTDLW